MKVFAFSLTLLVCVAANSVYAADTHTHGEQYVYRRTEQPADSAGSRHAVENPGTGLSGTQAGAAERPTYPVEQDGLPSELTRTATRATGGNV